MRAWRTKNKVRTTQKKTNTRLYIYRFFHGLSNALTPTQAAIAQFEKIESLLLRAFVASDT
jgi:hypothetical protein